MRGWGLGLTVLLLAAACGDVVDESTVDAGTHDAGRPADAGTARADAGSVTGPPEHPVVDAGTPKPPSSRYQRAPAANPIPAENRLRGDPSWRSGTVASAHQLELYTLEESVEAGDSVSVQVSSDTAMSATVAVFRVGYYGGVGARRVWERVGVTVQPQPACPRDADTARIECDWQTALSVPVGKEWVSGVYLVKVTRADGVKAFHPFVVRDHRAAELLFQPAFTTYQAYNPWGGESLYRDDSRTMPSRMGFEVSMNRPYSEGEGAGQFFNYEYAFIRTMEQHGYDVTYGSNLDFSRAPNFLEGISTFVGAGHDEYWTATERTQVEARVNDGMSYAYFGANGGYWRIRAEPDAHGRPLRTLVCFKDHPERDPQPGSTVRFRDEPNANAESELYGTEYESYMLFGLPLRVADGTHWIFEGTDLKTGDLLQGLLGYEYDNIPSEQKKLPGLRVSFDSPLITAEGIPGHAQAVDRTLSRGNLVFSAGTIYWAWGLSRDLGLYDARVERMTLNVLERALGPVRASRPLAAAKGTVSLPVPQGEPALSVDAFVQDAALQGPTALAVLASGEVLIADTVGNRIFLAQSGVVLPIAGTGLLGHRDGSGAQAMFRRPNGLAVLLDGTVLVADSDNHVLRALNRDERGSWIVATWAGGPREASLVDGSALAARFNRPTALAVAPDGTVYVADQGNNVIRSIAPDAQRSVRTLLPLFAQGYGFQTPSALAVAQDGSLFVVNAGYEQICRMSLGEPSVVTCLVGSFDFAVPYQDGTGAAVRMRAQMGLVALADGSLLFADTGNHRVRRLVPGADAASSVVTTFAGSGNVGQALGTGASADLVTPAGLAALPDGRVLVSDPFNHAVRVVTP